MVVHPVPRTPLPPQPGPALAQGIEKDTEEHPQPQHAEFDSDHSAGLQQDVFGRKWPLGGTERVVVEAVCKNPGDERDGNQVSQEQADLMTSLGVDRGFCRGDG